MRATVPKETDLVTWLRLICFQLVCRCLEAETVDVALQKCIFADQLPPIGNYGDTYDDTIKALQSDWWSRLVGGASSGGLSEDLYESIIARHGLLCVCVCVCV